jgi:hypothetical protein
MRIEIGERNDLLYLLLTGAGVLAVEARRRSGTRSR